MVQYILKRVFWGIFSLFIFVTLMFFLVQLMVPGDFVSQFAQTFTEAQSAAMREVLGLDLPLGQQYINWLRGILSGSLGLSYYSVPVLESMQDAFPVTLLVFGTGTAIAFLIGQWLGKVTAWRGPGLLTSVTTFSGIALYTAFPPWLAFLLAYAFGRRLNLFGAVFGLGGFDGLDLSLWVDATPSASQVAARMLVIIAAVAIIMTLVNIFLQRRFRRHIPLWISVLLVFVGTMISWQIDGFGARSMDVAQLALLPLIVFTLLTFGEIMLIMRTSMSDALDEDYVTLARAKGLPDNVVRDRHAARNAILPVLSRLVITLPYLMTGIVIIEDTLSWPGMGSVLWRALYWQDMPLVMGAFLFIGILSVVARVLLDILHAYLDPRIRLREATVDDIQ